MKLILFYLSILIILIIFIISYGYHSGSCKIKKSNYQCNKDFCLYKEFKLFIPSKILLDINVILNNKNLHKRVSIETYPENIFNCAMPNKNGITISTQNIIKYSPQIINYYQNQLKNVISQLLNLKLETTNLNMPTSCVILLYQNKGDWINWHYDYNYYNGRFFTVLIPITNEKTCTSFQFMDDNNNIKNINLTNNNCICFEGNYLYHRATKLCKNQKRAILSCQYVTDNKMSNTNNLRIKIKDFAYTGKLN